ncbi:MAG: hypothetical protein NXI18_13170 [Alphaproteobacteria bacterium]|nr:hypothetical protein [Alphaproteobacteria bacterium]
MAEAIETFAGRRDITSAEWCRQVLRGALDAEDLEEFQVPPLQRPVRRYRPARAPRPDYIQQVARLREVLGEVGGDLRQSINLMRIEGRPDLARQIDEYLPVIRAAVEEVQRVKTLLLVDFQATEGA